MPRPTKNTDPNKQLMIKVKVAQRLAKEVSYYEKEVKENEDKLAKMKSDGKDPYDIKKFEEVLGESLMMIPDSQNRYNKSLDDLKEFIAANEEELDGDGEGDWLETGKSLIESL